MRKIKRAILVGGVSGSGKSNFADQLLETLDPELSAKSICARNFFDEYYNGVYQENLIYHSHEWCKNRIKEFCENNVNIIIVHNTFLKSWEVQNYKKILKSYEYSIKSLRVLNENLEPPDDIPEEKFYAQLDRIEELYPKSKYKGVEMRKTKINSNKLKPKPKPKNEDISRHSLARMYY